MQKDFRALANLVILFFIFPAAQLAYGLPAITWKIGIVLPSSGSLAEYGKQTLSGMEAALKRHRAENPGRPIKIVLVKEDDRGSEKIAREKAAKLYNEDHVHLILGSLTSVVSSAIAEVASERRQVLVMPTASYPGIASDQALAFQIAVTDPMQGKVMANFAKQQLRKKRAVTITEANNSLSVAVADSFEKTFVAGGGSVIAKLSYASDLRDFAELIRQLQRNQPDFVFMPSSFQEASQLIFQARKAGLKMPFLGTDSWDTRIFQKASPEKHLLGCYFLTPFTSQDPHPTVKTFVEYYQSLYNKKPGIFAAQGYDAMNLLIKTLSQLNTYEPIVISRGLSATADFPVLGGRLTMSEKGEAVRPLTVMVTTSAGAKFMTRITP